MRLESGNRIQVLPQDMIGRGQVGPGSSSRCHGKGRAALGGQGGFTLFELLGVAMIFSILTFLSVNLYNSFKSRSELSETQDRLRLIATKIKQYYLSHEQMPAAAGTGLNEVPVQTGALDMEQKYRLDGWGQYLVYTGPPAGDLTNITNVDGFAASIRSWGPDQASGTVTTLVDDILVYVDVTAEAREITRHKLKLLQEKIAAYDALFGGIDNDGDGVVDNQADAGEAAQLNTFAALADNTCPPTKNFANDPSEGYATLDAIETGAGLTAYNCSSPLINHILLFYHLPGDPNDTASVRGDYGKDAWGRPILWGYLGRPLPDGTTIQTSDPRFHRFFSTGPDLNVKQDDIIFTAE